MYMQICYDKNCNAHNKFQFQTQDFDQGGGQDLKKFSRLIPASSAQFSRFTVLRRPTIQLLVTIDLDRTLFIT